MKVYKIRSGIGDLNAQGKSYFERDLDTLVNNQIYAPNIRELNDPMEGFVDDSFLITLLESLQPLSVDVLNSYDNLYNSLIQKNGIYSLTKDVKNELLWSYYGSSHYGFAIEYDLDRLKFCLNHNDYFRVFDLDVDYVEKVPIINIEMIVQPKNCDFIKTFIGTKSKAWQHENELRVIFNNDGLHEIDYRSVTGIYFGVRMSETEMNLIMKKLAGRGIAYYKMKLDNATYKLYPSRIDDPFKNAEQYTQNIVDYDIDQLISYSYFTKDEVDKYKELFIEALELIKNEPYISKFNFLAITYENDTPLLKVFAKIKTGFPPQRDYLFKINEEGNVHLIQT